MNLRPKHNIYKSDLFSLGVCLINAALLESCDDIYNFTKYSINELALEEKIEKLKIQYPYEFVSIIQQMVFLDEKNRLDFILLEKNVEEQKKLFIEKNFVPKPPVEGFSNNNQLVFFFFININFHCFSIDLFNKCAHHNDLLSRRKNRI